MKLSEYINKTVELEIKKILKEQEEEEQKTDDEVLVTFDKMNSFIKDEKQESDTAIKNSLKLMSALSEPVKRSAENMNINVQKQRIKKLDTMQKGIDTQKKSFEDSLRKKQTQSQTTQQIAVQTENSSMPVMKREFAEGDNVSPTSVQPQALETPMKKAYIVKFDTKTEHPFEVKFSERGFSINGTRLSFEALENALSKNYTIVLDNGSGLPLNAIRMQKILKYKDKWY